MSERITVDKNHLDSIEGNASLSGLTAFINAGGRGTRLSSLFEPGAKGICKALLPIGKPPITFVEHQVNKLIRAGVPTIVADVGDHKDAAEHVRATYRDDPRVHALHYEEPLESGGGLVRIVREHPHLFKSHIYICCIDTILDIDEADMLNKHVKTDGEITIALTRNSNVPNEGAYYVGLDQQVLYTTETTGMSNPDQRVLQNTVYRGSSTGAIIANVDYVRSVAWNPSDGPMSLYRDASIIGAAVSAGSMYAYDNGDKLFTDVGTVESWNRFHDDYDMMAPYIHYT